MNDEPPSVSDSDMPPLTLSRLLRAMRRAWLPMLVGGIAVMIAFSIVAFTLKPVYRAVAVVIPVTESPGGGALGKIAGQLGGLSAIAGIGLPNGSDRDEAVAILRSRSFGEQIIAEKNLMQTFFASRWDANSSTFRADWRGRVPTMEDAWRVFDERVRAIVEDRDRGLISLRIELGEPQLAAVVANHIVRRANEIIRQRKIDELSKSLKYLEAELARAHVTGLEQAISRVIETQINERMLASVRSEYAFRTIDPAVPPDLNRPVWPQKPLLAAYGFTLGAGLGLGFATWRRRRRRYHRLQAQPESDP
ncbi:MAG: hypothetical protein KDI32_02995 [Pseudomonadales bacterium]|nr:hypothetical protein [Pseudomonadales bacterium]